MTDEILTGRQVFLRCIKMEDCTETYLHWLQDTDVNRYLETRWEEQTLAKIQDFVAAIRESVHSVLFAIIENEQTRHIGNIKLGPVNPYHFYGDVSYFLGRRESWGKGYATEAISLATDYGFNKLGLRRVQAGVYEKNTGSRRALEKAGFQLEGCYRRKFRTDDGYQDHLIYGVLAEEWR